MIKNKHNKKKNTKFLYEVLVRELTKSVLKEEENKRDNILFLLNKYFKKGTILSRELELYSILTETRNMEEKLAEKLLEEVKRTYFSLGKTEIEQKQTSLMDDIKKALSKEVLYTYVPNYRDIATIYQLFNRKLSPDKRVILENQIVKVISSLGKKEEKKDVEKTDKLVFSTFLKNFNSHYSENLLCEQKELLTKYIISSPTKQLELKIFLNEELGRLKETISKVIVEDREIKEKIEEVKILLESYKEKPYINEEMIEQIMRLQQLAKEIQSNVDTN